MTHSTLVRLPRDHTNITDLSFYLWRLDLIREALDVDTLQLLECPQTPEPADETGPERIEFAPVVVGQLQGIHATVYPHLRVGLWATWARSVEPTREDERRSLVAGNVTMRGDSLVPDAESPLVDMGRSEFSTLGNKPAAAGPQPKPFHPITGQTWWRSFTERTKHVTDGPPYLTVGLYPIPGFPTEWWELVWTKVMLLTVSSVARGVLFPES